MEQEQLPPNLQEAEPPDATVTELGATARHSRRKWCLILLLGLAVALSLIAVIYLLVFMKPATRPARAPVYFAYISPTDGYSIDLPTGWPRKERSQEDHIAVTLYPPGTDLSVNVPGGPQSITISWAKHDNGWAAPGQSHDPTDESITESGVFNAGGVVGHVSMHGGPMGRAIRAVFPRGDGFIILSADIEQKQVYEVFKHMLSSIKFR